MSAHRRTHATEQPLFAEPGGPGDSSNDGWVRAAARILEHRAQASGNGGILISAPLAVAIAAHLRAELDRARRAAA